MPESRFDSYQMDSKTYYTSVGIKDILKNLEKEVDDKLIDSREKSLCFTKLEEASFWITRCLAMYGTANHKEDPS